MALHVTSDENGVDIKVSGEVGDIFAEAIAVATHIANEFHNRNTDLTYAFVDYLSYIINSIVDDEEFDPDDFVTNMVRVVRTDPDKALERHGQLFEKPEDDKSYAYVLLGLKSDYEKDDES